MNSDIICEFPLTEMIEYHKTHGKEMTMLIKEIEDPSKSGVVIVNDEGLV